MPIRPPSRDRRHDEPRGRKPTRDDAARAPHEKHEPHPRTQNAPEHKVAGRNACRALFEMRKDDIRRVYVTDETLKQFGDVLKWCAQQRIAYHVKTNADLDQVAETVHHDGVCFIARVKQPGTLDDVVARLEQRGGGRALVVLLEDVKNPHNLGAILRVCAHFGVVAVLAAGDTPALSPAAMRTAEGGAEHVDVVPVSDALDAIARMKRAGLTVVATSSHTDHVLGEAALPSRALVLFGSEGAGLSRRVLGTADVTLAIPGSGALESLNVACASSVILWELWRAPASSSPASSRPPPPPSARAPRPAPAPPSRHERRGPTDGPRAPDRGRRRR